ncbi:hypothetical protein EHI8A_104600 [Entamoeba histolytica HM-1:IMSS-B]|uniref:Coiled-coil domain containing protein n=6 Tax=Entamoeba histolytica TaxID=5759 RepID=C4MAL5_ENTH1|nr:hypothetical protein, conserved [Entamoeba histolytica HM-1:IMSS]EMD45498.1 coiledcoil domain containing protein [Entamoeba histolytica KU27]EMH73121.1 hypothetical protein EHI8A_104600 [Entamoeba histolytica HM-1:IMSS-B]EMS14231.1 coiled-coil domain containing protein [Entamoeba histolytica HM-3:IMSS]ENY61018.1 coiled-coil domain containing protein [Entamoeba histolytica HM-1:IMSS-A]GAT98858.1 hypothetical protein conserved [Entamoeba histolytica]|eukprot:XP_650167.1 hypothetical protein, conserved [Entamoeba histolytica HM-1:IMSS]
MQQVYDFPILLGLLNVYCTIPSSLQELIEEAQYILPKIINSIHDTPILKTMNEGNLFQRIEYNKIVLQQCQLLGAKITLTSDDLTQPKKDVYSQILSTLWQMSLIDMKYSMRRIEKEEDITNTVRQWMRLFLPNQEVNVENTQKLLHIIEEDEVESNDNSSQSPAFDDFEEEDKEIEDDFSLNEDRMKAEEEVLSSRILLLEKELGEVDMTEDEMKVALQKYNQENETIRSDILQKYQDLTSLRVLLQKAITQTHLQQKELQRLVNQKDTEASDMMRNEQRKKEQLERKKAEFEEMNKQVQEVSCSVIELEFQIGKMKMIKKEVEESYLKVKKQNKQTEMEVAEKEEEIEKLMKKIQMEKKKMKEFLKEKNRIRKKRIDIENQKKLIEMEKKDIIMQREYKENYADLRIERIEKESEKEISLLHENSQAEEEYHEAEMRLKEVKEKEKDLKENDEFLTQRIKRDKIRKERKVQHLEKQKQLANNQKKEKVIELIKVNGELDMKKDEINISQLEKQRRIESTRDSNRFKTLEKKKLDIQIKSYKKTYRKKQEKRIGLLKGKMKNLTEELDGFIEEEKCNQD